MSKNPFRLTELQVNLLLVMWDLNFDDFCQGSRAEDGFSIHDPEEIHELRSAFLGVLIETVGRSMGHFASATREDCHNYLAYLEKRIAEDTLRRIAARV